MFDSRERIEAIIAILEEEIDFHNFTLSGVILAHFPLHKRNLAEIQRVFDEKKWSLMKSFVTGGYENQMRPMNFVKSYMGEKYAFEFSFLLHYQAWLVIPMVFGIILTIYQGVVYSMTDSMSYALDSRLNGFYGIFLALWA